MQEEVSRKCLGSVSRSRGASCRRRTQRSSRDTTATRSSSESCVATSGARFPSSRTSTYGSGVKLRGPERSMRSSSRGAACSESPPPSPSEWVWPRSKMRLSPTRTRASSSHGSLASKNLSTTLRESSVSKANLTYLRECGTLTPIASRPAARPEPSCGALGARAAADAVPPVDRARDVCVARVEPVEVRHGGEPLVPLEGGAAEPRALERQPVPN